MSTNTELVTGGRTPTDSVVRRVWDSSKRSRPVLIVDVVLIMAFAVTQPVFLHWDNIQNLMVGVSVLAIIAFGQTFVLLTGAADLSVAATSALCGYLLGTLLTHGMPAGFAIVLVLLFGAVLGGLINGMFVGVLGLSFFVVTLASMTAFTGAVNLWSDTKSILIESPFLAHITRDNYFGLPSPVYAMIAVLLILAYVQNFTMWGRDVYAVGGNISAARLSGIRTERVLIGVYALVGVCAAIGGILTAGQIGVSSPTVDGNLPLQAIAAVLLGGASLAGGAGGVGGTLLGVIFLGVLQNGLGLAGIPSFWQQVLTGVILLLAVLGDRLTGWSTKRFMPFAGLGRKGAAAQVASVTADSRVEGGPEATPEEGVDALPDRAPDHQSSSK